MANSHREHPLGLCIVNDQLRRDVLLPWLDAKDPHSFRNLDRRHDTIQEYDRGHGLLGAVAVCPFVLLHLRRRQVIRRLLRMNEATTLEAADSRCNYLDLPSESRSETIGPESGAGTGIDERYEVSDR